MIQRIQTLWFLLGAIFIALVPILAPISALSALPLPEYVSSVLIGLVVLISVMTFIAIFRFKDRKGQKLLALMLVVDVLVLLGFRFGFLYATAGESAILEGANAQINATAFGLMLLAIFCFLLAKRGIEADEKLLKSVDRLRD